MHQNLTASFRGNVFETDRRHRAYGVTLLKSRHGLLLVLASHLFALKLSGGGRDDLVEFAFRRILEIEVETFTHCAALAHDAAKLEVEFDIPCIAFEVVENHNEVLGRTRIHIGEKRHHAGAFYEITTA
ncbi:hypothetical protein TALK_13530 [Thalassospira alkalitolerans]|uniref:Uncharacterized protein n=1 Tax=Thalassospira alkalitolerans TaxID=1293890 RepID=A0A1Y2LA82_9PROT|nr:hypothetical protein [Thalassospira alkalitolerans]OSQ47046.1 hypothetical protein TALK_13530 [Thalassospira alkalitolerans]